jgi:hypothetical protein
MDPSGGGVDRIIMKTVRQLLLLIFIFSAVYCFSDGVSFINDSDVNLRDFPSIEGSRVISKLNKGQEVIVNAKTIEKDKIGSSEMNWFYVGPVGTQSSGWVFGQFLTVDQSFRIEEISRMRLWRNIFADALFKSLLGGDVTDKFDESRLLGYELLESRDTSFWQMKESGFTKLRTYQTDFGELSLFFNESDHTWMFRQIVISRKNISDKFRIGVTTEEMTKIIGYDFEQSNSSVTYAEDSSWDKYVYEAAVKDGKISKFMLARYFD